MVASDEYHERWEGMWGSAESVQPGQRFDAERAAPSLVKYLENTYGDRLPEGMSVMVPGCGRGYDLVLFDCMGASTVVGLEISPSATKVAQEYVKAKASGSQSIAVEQGDWLKDAALGPFDLGYDYTFFCALHPDMRADWADGWARRIKPGGHLIALMFPVEPDGREGPPWPVQPEAYDRVLEPLGFRKILEEKVADADATTEGRKGREILTVYEKVLS